MAQTVSPAAGQKRGPGRPPKTGPLVHKKPKIDTQLSPFVHSPAVSTPTTEKRPTKLAFRIYDNRSLPTLAEPQSLTLSNDEYQSIASSAVLQASLDRSRARWIGDGVFERYWTKPESGKNARPPPPHNPEVKWMKHKGECRIRVEPHIFQAEMYVEEKAKPPPPPKQYVPCAPATAPAHAHSAYGQPYRQQPYQSPSQHYQSRALPPINQPQQHDSRTLPPIHNLTPSNPSAPAPTPASRAPQQPAPAQEKKANPDPVISMLASRASSDPELKALMKEVATGNATQDQLRVFQKHIDELGEIIKEQKKADAEKEKEKEENKKEAEQAQANGNAIQYDGAAENKPAHAPAQQYQSPQPPAPLYLQPPPPPPPSPYVAPPSTSQPVILAFTTPGATEDRFLFPQHSILESLSPQHVLASFIATRQTHRVTDRSLDSDLHAEYWQPITILIEVQYGKEYLLDCVRRWVKPAEEVRKHMQETMKSCVRAPESFLALRLPVKGSAMAMGAGDGDEGWSFSEANTRDATPVRVVVREEKPKVKGSVKYVKKKKSALGTDGTSDAAAASTAQQAPPAVNEQMDAQSRDLPAVSKGIDGAADDEPPVTGSGRPRRAVRKSVRISEG